MSRFRFLLALVLVVPPAAAVALDPNVAPPPVAKKVPHKLERHGDVRTDDYFWIKDKTNGDVLKYLEAENAYAAAVLKPTGTLQEKLYGEFLSRIKQTDQDVPVRDRGYRYYSRTVEGKQYPIRCRKKGAPDAPEEVLLDGNELAKGEKFFSFGGMAVSDDGHLLAYSTDTTGFREYVLYVKDLRTGKLIEDKLVKAPQFEWAADNKTLFYLTEDEAKRASKVWRHVLGTPKEKDALVYEEKDELFWLELSKTRDGKVLFHSSVSYGSTEVRFLPADKPTGEWKTIAKREPEHEYDADHRDGTFYIRTNKKATNFKVVTCPAEKTDPANWTDLAPYDPKVYVEGVAVFKDHAVLSVRVGGLTRLVVRDLRTGAAHTIAFGDKPHDVALSRNPEFDTTSIRFTYTALAEPDTEYGYDMNTRERKRLKVKEIPGGYKPGDYVTERVNAIAQDGTRVPISLVYKKGLKRDGSAPCLLYGYGSYGLNMPMDFDPVRVSLLDRGVVYAIAHIRGGSDLGRSWYDDGKMLRKMNTFTDFVACADFLVAEKYCARDRLAIEGASAGGLLIAATLNLRPDLCKVAVLKVPFVDAITTMLDESIPLTVQEFQQWGNPKVKAEYDYLRKYCPYTNMKRADYPAMFVMTSLNDSQVLFHEPTKYVAKLRTMRTDKNPLLLRCNMDAGHGGASGRYDHLKENALVLAFVLDQMGISK
ncbi:MAG: S9 family peptidase [Planctomycetes bacterium]|nr:S9 family peptidase [Planctomycetota bacterium]